MDPVVSRRRYVQFLDVSAVVGLAGCSDSSDDSETIGEEPEPGDEEEDDSRPEEQTDGPQLRDVFNWEDSYIMEITSTDGAGQIVYYQGDSYSTWSSSDGQFESYQIDGDSYSVFDGQCYRFASDPMDEEFDPQELVEDEQEYFATGKTTIDEQEVYEFDLGHGLYYLSVSNGYPVRLVDSEGAVVDFHSWGETSPISPPDMDCISV